MGDPRRISRHVCVYYTLSAVCGLCKPLRHESACNGCGILQRRTDGTSPAAQTEVGRVRHRQIFLEACPARSWAVACELNLVMASAQPSLANFGIVLTGRLGLRNDLLSTFSVGKDVWEECGPATHSHEPMSQAQDRGMRMRVLRGYAWTAPALERKILTERAPPSSSQALLRAYAQGASLLRPQARCWRPP